MYRGILFLLFLLWTVTAAGAATLCVWSDRSSSPDCYLTIQAAIDAAHDGDVIRLRDGVFTGPGNRDIDFLGKRLTVRSDSGDPAKSTIDCQNGWSGFLITSSTGNSTLLGITIANAYAEGQGGAVECVNASPAITDCVFRNCRASEGGAVSVNLGSPVITGCTFDNCYASGNGGGGVFYFQAGGTRTPCSLAHCTFYGNDGIGACVASLNSTVQITNTIMAFGIWGEPVSGASDSVILSCCDVFGNAGGDWVGCIANQQGVRHNFSADPYFCLLMADPHSFRLYDLSPCTPGGHADCGLIGAWPVGCDGPAVAILPGHEFQDGFGRNSPQFLDPSDVGNADIAFDVGGGQAGANAWLGDSAVVAGPPVTGLDNSWLVRLCFRISRKGPMQNSIPAYGQWKARLPADPEQDFVCVLMDSVETGGVARTDSFATYFREGEPGYLASAPDLSEAQEILPDGVFVPGTRIEYYYASFWANDRLMAPEQRTPDTREFEILPGMRWSGGGRDSGPRRIVWPSVLYVDATDDSLVPEWESPTTPRIGTTQEIIGDGLDRLNIPYDRYDYGGASAEWNAPLARSLGGTGHNPGGYGNNGCALMQLLGYRLLFVNTGTKRDLTMEAADFNLIDTWLSTSICDIRNYPRGLILNGDAIAFILNGMDLPPGQTAREGDKKAVSGQYFLNNTLGVQVHPQDPNAGIASSFCIFLEADDPKAKVMSPFEPDMLLAAYGDSVVESCHFAYSIVDTMPGTEGVAGNLRYLDPDPPYAYLGFAQIATSRTEGTNWRSVVDGFSLAHLVRRSQLPGICQTIPVSTDSAIVQLLRPELEWIMRRDPQTELALWSYPCTPGSAGVDSPGGNAASGGWALECRPSPCAGRALLRVHAPAAARVRIDVYDVAGRSVRTFDPGQVTAGVHDFMWDGCGESGKPAASGVYWVQARSAAGPVARQRLVLLR